MGQNNSPAAEVAIPHNRDFMGRIGTLEIPQEAINHKKCEF